MKTLIVFYSRTGNTRKVAKEIANNLECDIEEIIDTKKRSGMLGFMRSGRDASSGNLTVLENIKNDPTTYDLLIIGTPMWAGHVSVPIRTYISQNHEKFKDVAFFCTANGIEFEKLFQEMSNLVGKSPLSTLGIRAKEIKDKIYLPKLETFIEGIKS